MKNKIHLVIAVLTTLLFACQSPDKTDNKLSKPKTIEPNKKSSKQNSNQAKNKINKQINNNKVTSKAKNQPKTITKPKAKNKKSKYPTLEEQKKVLGLTDKHVNDIIDAQRNAKKDRNNAKKKNNGKIPEKEINRINNARESKIKRSLGLQLYNKRQNYIQNYKSK